MLGVITIEKKVYTFKNRLHSAEMSEREKSLKGIWTNYFKYGIDLGEVRSVIHSSWQRSQSYHIDPNVTQPPICTIETLKKKQLENKEILSVVRPFMDDLFEIVKGTDSIIAFSDTDGVVLDLCGDSEIALNAASVNFTVGASMSEEFIGTNSIGTSIATGKAVQVIGAEHYCVSWHSSHCSSAPIKDPFTNDLIGVITLIGYVRSAHPHSLGIVRTASETITKLIEHQGIKKYMNHYFGATIDLFSDGVMMVNQFGKIIRLNKIATRLLKIPSVENINEFIYSHDQLHPLMNVIQKAIHRKDAMTQYEISYPYDGGFQLLVTARKVMDVQERIGTILLLRKKKIEEHKKRTATHTFSSLIGVDPAFKKAIKLGTKASDTDKSVLIIGESGTGKELFAQAIHNKSNRQAEPFVALNCGAITKELIASELFGYVDGAFTNAARGGRKGKFEAANGGTLFLDEIGEMPFELQAYLLRVLEEKEVVPIGANQGKPVDVRIIAATNKDLYQLVQENKFRLDLYYRLNVISLNLPALRKRKQDIELFVKHYLPTKTFSSAVLKFFYEYKWPGNLRELKNVTEQIELFCEEDQVTEEDLPDYMNRQLKEKMETTSLYQAAANDTKMETMMVTLKNSKSVSEAAKKLGISASTFYRWASDYNLNMRELLQK
ncbi:sigma-54-dependent Fis family transcriptional regulator [Mesobacillus maritimus]|uniref:sigma-54-dependent Fis family transcriptional regulator n=1 Tax=Mesobacillus maritimus TaxID=1643336 RepID=UPI00384D2960